MDGNQCVCVIVQTLDLLYRMTNPVNVEVIVDKQLYYLRTTTDVFLRTDLVSRITQAAEKYAPNNSWYIQTMTMVRTRPPK